MTVTVLHGFDITTSQKAFAQYEEAKAIVQDVHGVVDGLVVSPGPGVRQVKVTPGHGIAVGTLFKSDAEALLTLDANPTTGVRTDMVALEVNWKSGTSPLGTPGRSAALVVVKGESAADPGLTKEAGELWQMALGRIPVPAGYAAPFTADHIKVCKPIPRKIQPPFRGGPWRKDPFGTNIEGGVLTSVSIPDPGWPYYLSATAEGHFGLHTGRVILGIEANGTYFANGLSASADPDAGEYVQQVPASGVSPLLTGPALVRARLTAVDVGGIQIGVVNPGYSHLTVLQIPA